MYLTLNPLLLLWRLLLDLLFGKAEKFDYTSTTTPEYK